MKSSRSLGVLLRFVFAWLLFSLGATPLLGGCYAETSEDDTGSSEDAVGARLAERFPTRANVEASMDHYARDPASARARSAMSVEEFFGGQRSSMNIDRLRVELLKPNPRFTSPPIAFLRAQFHGTDMYWNNRYKDVQLYRLIESTGTQHNPFPEAKHIPNEGSALVRMWTDYTPISKGAPEGLHGDALLAELARITVWSYVSGNVDGPAHNGNNGGFSRFRDASGREFWRGVLIDAGAAWNRPDASHRPWNSNLLGRGPVERSKIPEDVINSLKQIARASAEELASRSRFEAIDEGAREIVRGIRERAREVLEHYGIQWQSAQILRFPNRAPAYATEVRVAA